MHNGTSPNFTISTLEPWRPKNNFGTRRWKSWRKCCVSQLSQIFSPFMRLCSHGKLVFIPDHDFVSWFALAFESFSGFWWFQWRTKGLSHGCLIVRFLLTSEGKKATIRATSWASRRRQSWHADMCEFSNLLRRQDELVAKLWMLRHSLDDSCVWTLMRRKSWWLSRLPRSKSRWRRIVQAEPETVKFKRFQSGLRLAFQDPYPLPLYSNCWTQFILRGLGFGQACAKTVRKGKALKAMETSFQPQLCASPLSRCDSMGCYVVLCCLKLRGRGTAASVEGWFSAWLFSWGYPFHLPVDPFSGSHTGYSEHYGWNLSESIV